MRFRVLGCSGGELPQHRTTCFLVDGRLAIDAGALTSSLPLRQLLEVDDVVLTHSHFDHVKDVPLLADLLVGRRETAVRVHASTECARTLRKNIFNGKLWPDFTRIPSQSRPVIELRAFTTRRAFRAGGLNFQPVPVRHPVESVGFVVSNGRSSFGISGDTGPTTAFWKLVNQSSGLKALLVELSFPNELQRLGLTSRLLGLYVRVVGPVVVLDCLVSAALLLGLFPASFWSLLWLLPLSAVALASIGLWGSLYQAKPVKKTIDFANLRNNVSTLMSLCSFGLVLPLYFVPWWWPRILLAVLVALSAIWPVRAVLRNDGELRRRLWRGIGA